ncbi:MAG: hypothetical protein J6125_02940 [Clostridia bacterium]|nr:hypothetical protein [Clostridia bacterium]
MKKIAIILLLLICCLCLLTACAGKGKGTANSQKITTSKSGKIDVSVHTPGEANKEGKIELTPLLSVEQKGITDDAKGLRLLTATKTGEGSVSLSGQKARPGETITVTAAPADKWKLASISVNGEPLPEGVSSFTMPDRDVAVAVVFADRRHLLLLGDHVTCDLTERPENWNEYSSPAYTVLEGDRYVVTVDYEDENGYYDDEDVACAYYDYATSQTVPVALRAEGSGRYSFTAPAADCYISVTTHACKRVTGVSVFEGTGNDAVDYTDLCQVTVLCDGQPYTLGDRVRQTARFSVSVTAPFPFLTDTVTYNEQGSYRTYSLAATVTDNVAVFDAGLLWVDSCDLRLSVRRVWSLVCDDCEGGEISVDRTGATRGETVTVTVTPDDGFIPDALRYTTDGVTYTDLLPSDRLFSDGVYTFDMPAGGEDGSVRLTASFKACEWYDCSIDDDRLGAWTVTGALSGVHTAESEGGNTVRLIWGESFTVTLTAGEGYLLHRVGFYSNCRHTTVIQREYMDSTEYEMTVGSGSVFVSGDKSFGMRITVETRSAQ